MAASRSHYLQLDAAIRSVTQPIATGVITSPDLPQAVPTIPDIGSCDERPPERCSIRAKGNKLPCVSVRHPTQHITLRPWFTQSVWDISIGQSYCGWTMNLRSYNLLPSDAPIFSLARKGDIGRIRRLVETNIASPFDSTVYHGHTQITFVGRVLTETRDRPAIH